VPAPDAEQGLSPGLCFSSRASSAVGVSQRSCTQRSPWRAGGSRAALPVRYQFHEGYTNAVRRPVRMQDLL